MKDRILRHRYFNVIIFTLIVLLFSSTILFFIFNDNCRPCGDEARKLFVALRFYSALLEKENIFNTENYHPPLYFLLPSFICFLVKNFSYRICTSVNLLYYILTVFFIYLLTKKVTRNKLSALLSVLFFSFAYYCILNYSRLFLMEFGLSAFVCASIFLLTKTDYFKNRRYSLIFGILAGLGMLMKWTFIIYIIGPFLVYIIFTYQDLRLADRKYRIQICKNIFSSLILGIVLFSIWAIPFLDFNELIDRYICTLRYESSILNISNCISMFLGYIKVSILSISLVKFKIGRFNLLTAILTALMILSFYLFMRKAKKRDKYLLFAWFFTPLCILPIVVGYVEMRYVIPVIAAQTIIIVTGLGYIAERFKKPAIALFIFPSLFLFIINSMFIYSSVESTHPVEEAILQIAKDTSCTDKNGSCAVIPDLERESLTDLIKYFIEIHNLRIVFLGTREYIREGKIIKEFDADIIKEIQGFHYFISDYNPVDNSPLIENNIILKNQLRVYKRFLYWDTFDRGPKLYWSQVSIYKRR